MGEGNLGLIATGKSNLDGVTHMELWRMRGYTYEITASSYVGYPKGFNKATELLEETPYEVAVKKFENMVDKVSLM